METETKSLTVQQLALYLGCEAEFKFGNTIQIQPITGSHLEAFSAGLYTSVKIFLRKLEDIIEEEAKEVYYLMYDNPDACMSEQEIAEYLEADSSRTWTYKDKIFCLEEHYAQSIQLSIGTPKVWLYLLSKRFDLFKWIPQNLALDATKQQIINPP